MSFEAYKVAVRVSLIDGVTRGLQLMSRHFKQTDADAKGLEARLKSIGKLAAVGGALTGAGFAGLSLFKGPIEEAMKYERALGSLRQMGLGDSQIADARKFAEATNIIGTSINDRIRIFADAQGSFRQSGMSGAKATAAARTMAPVLARYEVATSMLDGDKRVAAEQAMRNLNKTVEIMGGITDPKRAAAIADGVFKAAMSSGRMVDERQLKQFVAYGSSATNQLDLTTIFGALEPIIGELGGSQTAVGLRTAYTRTNGMTALMPRRLQAEMKRLGMTDASGKQQNESLAQLQATNSVDYAKEMMKRYASAGITSRTDIERENAVLFGGTGSKVYNKIMSQMPVLLESIQAYNRSQGIGQVTADPRNKPLLAAMNLEKKEADLKLLIGKTIMPYYVRGLELAAAALTRLDNFVDNHQTIAKLAFGGLALVSTLAVIGGGIALFTAGIQGLLLIGKLAGVARYAVTGLTWFGRVLGLFGQLLMKLPAIAATAGRGLLIAFRASMGVLGPFFRAGMAAFGPFIRAGLFAVGNFVRTGIMLALSPIGLAIAAIAVVGLLVWNNWKEIKAAFFTICKDIYTGFYKLFHGDILGALGSFGHAFLLTFQTIINTIIAGVNRINPLFQIPKTSFAGSPDGNSPAVRPAGAQPQRAGDVYLDKHLVGKHLTPVISNNQGRAMGKPNTGGSGFDASRARPAVAGGR
ncbi:hypothetical protein [Sphingomonas sp. 10B4]|uniref:hypothetical protein n=1 Tax=Sphingomonas sp. 10B4 TaxID=3048575 RepID=UPI002AB42260|nr:hypothetical protein [Sphingomonas sp. 10B4]MDY7525483.1 hypothetical protein [Sphingomonas sp. 10B4]MEB0281427.1 hypothetical protein [Sphingomonas sp. 10B4]